MSSEEARKLAEERKRQMQLAQQVEQLQNDGVFRWELLAALNRINQSLNDLAERLSAPTEEENEEEEEPDEIPPLPNEEEEEEDDSADFAEEEEDNFELPEPPKPPLPRNKKK